MSKKIVTLTLNPVLDKISGIKHVQPNEKLRCDTPNFQAGGGGINVSRAIRKLGGDSVAVFPSGGPNGDLIRSKLEHEYVSYKHIAINDNTRENLTIFESSTTNQYRFIMPGPDITKEEYEKILETIRNFDPAPDFIIASGSNPIGTPEDFYKELSKIAKKNGSYLIVDTSGEHLKKAAHSGVYLLKPNMRELGQLAGTDIKSEAHQKEAAKSLINSGGAEIVVVSLGAGGALLVTQDITRHLRTPTVPIRSKLGAGDSMVGGMVFKLAQGDNILDAVQYGLAAGAATVMTEGIELCNKSDADTLYQRLIEKSSE